MRIVLGVILFLASFQVNGQYSLRPGQASISLRGMVSSGEQNPFWLWADQRGEIPYGSSALQIAGEVHKEYDSLYTQKRKLNATALGYGIRAVASLEKQNQLLLPEAYLKFRWKKLELSAGRRFVSSDPLRKDRELGKLMWGANSLPIPEIRLAIPEFTPIIKSGLLSIKGGYSHGWFGSTDSVKNYLLHQKSLYVRVGKPAWRMHFYAGANHQVQWGGRPANPFYDQLTNQMITKYPGDFGSYLKVVSGISLNRNNQGRQLDGVPYNEAFNRAGNHLGTLDVGISFESHGTRFFLYRQSYYEDGSLFYLSNISDGLTGLHLDFTGNNNKTFNLLQLNFDYLDTRNQGGEGGSGSTIPELRGRDNYFNNSLYQDGWTYRNRFIGVPLIIPVLAYRPLLPDSKVPDALLVNNRVQAGILELRGEIGHHFLTLKQVWSINQGSYAYPFDKLKQYSLLLGFEQYFRSGRSASYSLAWDQGELLGNQIGLGISVKQPLEH